MHAESQGWGMGRRGPSAQAVRMSCPGGGGGEACIPVTQGSIRPDVKYVWFSGHLCGLRFSGHLWGLETSMQLGHNGS